MHTHFECQTFLCNLLAKRCGHDQLNLCRNVIWTERKSVGWHLIGKSAWQIPVRKHHAFNSISQLIRMAAFFFFLQMLHHWSHYQLLVLQTRGDDGGWVNTCASLPLSSVDPSTISKCFVGTRCLRTDPFCKLKRYSAARGSGRWCRAPTPLSLDSFIISPSCCFCYVIQRKEFISGRMEPTSFHSGANTSRGQIHGAHVDDGGRKKRGVCLDPAFFNQPYHVGMTNQVLLRLFVWERACAEKALIWWSEDNVFILVYF